MKRKAASSPQLCSIYRRDLASLLPGSFIHGTMRVVSRRYYSTMVAGNLPRRKFGSFEILVVSEGGMKFGGEGFN